MSDPLEYKVGDKTGKTIIDEASSTITYVGYSISGAATSAAVWLIKRISVASTVTTTEWAGAGTDHDQIWDDRATLTYT